MPERLSAALARLARAATLPNALHALLSVTALSLAFRCFDGTLFGWHPFSMSVGYIFFMAEGLLSAWALRPTVSDERVRGIEAHALMQLRGTLFIAIGAGAIIYNKHRHGKPHFRTLHGRLGLLALILSAAAPLLGAVSFRKLGLIQRFPEEWHYTIKKAHRALGVVTWALALVTIEVALPHPAVYKPLATPLWQLSAGAAGALMALLLYGRQRRGDLLKGT
ncbi:hypothetical protein Rsub_00147 [Raphidocelis subcapitata]|uniref:Cytochrome b561 domain-containing protein n=1 Tax=Raphidocelis subcapitata TaxID=307507 RepID=A0A2V0NJN0_9CHLO|nr:hypothetical protein Rsub_00147 [Raphidocelis subcapitata]|eukprot:GBF87436.1 hypothetical protein Rsub_00147 [Raphidocelis subcapitata]